MTRRIVDALGTRCPVPVQLADRAAARLGPGDEIEVLADDPLIEVDLPAWCHERGHRLLELRRERGGYAGVVVLGG